MVVEGPVPSSSRELPPEKQDHSRVMELILINIMAMVRGVAVLELAAEKGVMEGKWQVERVDGVAKSVRHVEYRTVPKAVVVREESMVPMDSDLVMVMARMMESEREPSPGDR